MLKVVFTPRAKRELDEILSYIALDNPIAASKLKDELLESCSFLALNPMAGRKRTEFTSKNLRFWSVRKNYIIVYNSDPKTLNIYAVIHAARYIPNLV